MVGHLVTVQDVTHIEASSSKLAGYVAVKLLYSMDMTTSGRCIIDKFLQNNGLNINKVLDMFTESSPLILQLSCLLRGFVSCLYYFVGSFI